MFRYKIYNINNDVSLLNFLLNVTHSFQILFLFQCNLIKLFSPIKIVWAFSRFLNFKEKINKALDKI